MADGEWSPERRGASPDGIVLAVRDHLRRLLAGTPTPFPCRYACYLHSRRRCGERGFGVITLSGESLPLTVTMLEHLRLVPTLLEGRAPVVVGPGDQEDALIPAGDAGGWSVPLPVLRISIRLGDERDESAGPAQVLMPSLEGPQLTLLCANRPVGWPR